MVLSSRTGSGRGEERRGEIVVSPSLNFTILKFLLYYCSTCTRLGTTLGTTVTVKEKHSQQQNCGT